MRSTEKQDSTTLSTREQLTKLTEAKRAKERLLQQQQQPLPTGGEGGALFSSASVYDVVEELEDDEHADGEDATGEVR